MSRNQRRTRQDWQRIVREYRSAVQTQTAFARERGFHPTTLNYWLRRLESERAPDIGTDFVEITHAVSPPTEIGAALELDATGLLKFQTLPPPDYVAQLLAALRRC